MKLTLTLLAALFLIVTATASAETVNLGLVTMNAIELDAIRDTVAGRTEFVISTGNVSVENQVSVGLVNMAESDLEALKQMVANHRNTFRLPLFALNR